MLKISMLNAALKQVFSQKMFRSVSPKRNHNNILSLFMKMWLFSVPQKGGLLALCFIPCLETLSTEL